MKIGRRTRESVSTPAAVTSAHLSYLAISSVTYPIPRMSRRRKVDFVPFDLLVVPSSCIDLTALLLRQNGQVGRERLVVWAGTMVGTEAFVSTILAPADGNGSGWVSPEGSAKAHEALARRDLVPLAQLHSHPGRAYLSSIDRESPFFMCRGFLSVVVPNFGFVDMKNPCNWKVYRYESPRKWTELTPEEVERSIVVDDAVIVE